MDRGESSDDVGGNRASSKKWTETNNATGIHVNLKWTKTKLIALVFTYGNCKLALMFVPWT